LPNIRYHPYPRTGATKENSANTENTTVNVPVQKPFKTESTTVIPCSSNDVHSVPVPRGGSYTINKPSNETQTIRNPHGNEVSNELSVAEVS